MHWTRANAWLVAATTTTTATAMMTTPKFPNCGLDQYYQKLGFVGDVVATTQRQNDPSTTPLFDQDDLSVLIRHEGQIPILGATAEDDDIYQALQDLYPGPNSTSTRPTVQLVYRQSEMAFKPNANIDTWDRENLWPVRRGARRGTQALTDVHSTRPGDTSVLVRKADFFFGECGTVEDADLCTSPANLETPDDTAQDSKIFRPPAAVRGDIARSLFYTALRYQGELNLELSDCPPFATYEFGYLSTLLQWHRDDPVDDAERQRNDRACSRWQGNRNPFVDFPHLVPEYWGTPDVILQGTHMYSRCSTPTNAPTATPNQCSKMTAGDLPVYVINSDDPDTIIFFPLTDIPANIEKIYVTDQAWNGTDFVGQEGTVAFNIPEEGIRAGQSFGYGPNTPMNTHWDDDDEKFSLGIQGDQLLIYCRNADDIPVFIGAFSYNGDFVEPGLADYGETTSALPAALHATGALAIPHADNCLYTGQNTGTQNFLKTQFFDPANYECQNTLRYDVDFSSDAVGRGGLGNRMLVGATATAILLASSLF